MLITVSVKWKIKKIYINSISLIGASYQNTLNQGGDVGIYFQANVHFWVFM